MASKVLMPKLGAQMEEGTIVTWLVEIGEIVEEGDPLVEIQTDKITMEIEAEKTGVLLKKLYEEDTIVPVQEIIAFIGEEGEKIEHQNQDSLEEDNGTEKKENPYEQSASQTSGKSEEKVRRTPIARKLAEGKGIELSNIKGTGPQGRVQKVDVENAEKLLNKVTPLAKKVAESEDIDLSSIEGSGINGKIQKDDVLKKQLNRKGYEEQLSITKRTPLKGMRKIIAERMTESAYSAPHVTLNVEIDVEETVNLRKKLLPVIEEIEGIRVSYNDILVKVVSLALKKHPDINVGLKENEILHYRDVHVGVAVAMDNGLLVPVIRNTDEKNIGEITRETKEVIKKTRENKISQEELQGSTFTITNIGMFAVDNFNPIINQPNGAILGVGRIVKKPIVVEDEIEIRSMMGLSLSFDHRIIDGAPAAAFLTEIKEILENPYRILI